MKTYPLKPVGLNVAIAAKTELRKPFDPATAEVIAAVLPTPPALPPRQPLSRGVMVPAQPMPKLGLPMNTVSWRSQPAQKRARSSRGIPQNLSRWRHPLPREPPAP
ncbi:MAG: hypothetical protein ACKVP0_28450 [Pirellulaceae bacterium]